MRISLLCMLLAFAVGINAQSLRDSLFGGKLRIDTGGTVKLARQTNFTDTIIFIDADTSLSAHEKNEKEWKRFIELQPPLPGSDRKKRIQDGRFKAIISFVVEPDGTVTFIKADCDSRIEYLKPRFEMLLARAPKLIPSHKGRVYIRTIRNVGFVYTIEKNKIDIGLLLLNSLKE